MKERGGKAGRQEGKKDGCRPVSFVSVGLAWKKSFVFTS